MLNNLRPLLTKILEPLASRLNMNPNIFTIISPFIAIISAYFFAGGDLLVGALFILLSGFLDVVDGAVARYHNRASPFGAFLDSTMDRFADAIIFIGIIFGGYCHWFVGILAIHSSITVSYVRARAESQGIECNIGIAERAVRLIILILAAVIASIFNSNIIFTYCIYILVILSYFTVAQRVLHVFKSLNSQAVQRRRL
ncbi:archaetidylinositol phosphate synthase [Methanobrevibacter olleyae]|uniref:Archaetidylinositol phosphate synthase n=1 Tax=Methanobrevibacter olleyae TaxID=294671 RepID=A0A1I4HKN7_METOL|nr:archaetidylinositol phosphate synthase [Methanobrevibacter olleyae]SFL42762.1 archaetidylinositol phosphate synthase [Methanobrevibacter olleyae]